MPASTPQGLPYPLPTEPVAEGAQAIRNLAEAIKGWQLVAEIDAAAVATISGIPAVYDHLRILARLRSPHAVSGESMYLRLNNVATASYGNMNSVAANGAITVQQAVSQVQIDIGGLPGASAAAGFMATLDLLVPASGIADGNVKMLTGRSTFMTGPAVTQFWSYVLAGYAPPGAVNRVDLYPAGGGLFAAGSRIWVYGVSGV